MFMFACCPLMLLSSQKLLDMLQKQTKKCLSGPSIYAILNNLHFYSTQSLLCIKLVFNVILISHNDLTMLCFLNIYV